MENENKVSAASYLDSVDFDSIDAELKGDVKDNGPVESKQVIDEEELDAAAFDNNEEEELNDEDDVTLDEDGNDVSESKIDPDELLDYKVKLKVDGKEEEASIKELVDNYQLGTSARKRFEEASKKHKEAESVLTVLKDPELVWDALAQLGHDVDKLADTRVVRNYKLQNMSPRERKIYEQEQALKAREHQLEVRRRQAEQEQQEKMAKEFKSQLRPKIEQALEENGMPKSQKMYIETVKTLKEYGDFGEKLTFDMAARLTKKRLREEMSAFYETTPGEELEKIGAKVNKKKPQKPTVRERSRSKRDSHAKKKFKNSDDFFKSIRNN